MHVPSIINTFWGCYSSCCWNRRWLGCLKHGGSSFMRLSCSTLGLFIHLMPGSTSDCLSHTARSHISTPYRWATLDVPAYSPLTTSICTRWACHTVLFRLKSLIGKWLRRFSSFLPVSSIIWLSISSYPQRFLINTKFQLSTRCQAVPWLVSLLHIRWDIMSRRALISNTGT